MINSLFEQLSNYNSLNNAWLRIKEKGAAGGIDNVSCELFEKDLANQLNNILALLGSGNYIPKPYAELKIPKDENEFRILNLPAISDKIVQQTLRNIIEPVLDEKFLDVSYGYRTGKGPLKAIRRVVHIMDSEKKCWLVQCDIDNFFDSIPHQDLAATLKFWITDEAIINMIMTWISMGSVDRNLKWKDKKCGIPLGCVLSPLLSNIYLHSLDEMMVKKNYGYVRYADDFVILTENRNDGFKALAEVKNFIINHLHLKLNKGSQVTPVAHGFQFLGVLITAQGISIDNEKLQQLKNKITGNCNIVNQTLKPKFFEALQGISAYYKKLIDQAKLEELDACIEVTLRQTLSKAYTNKLLQNKQQIRDCLQNIEFFSQRYELQHNDIKNDIVTSCKKRKQREITGEVQIKPSEQAVKIRKRQIQKLESAGMELIVSMKGIFLGTSNKQIIIKKAGKNIEKISSGNLKHISIMSDGISISADVIRLCTSKNISIDFFDFNGNPFATISQPFHTAHDLGKSQLEAHQNGKAVQIAKAIVTGKIKNQINLIKYFNKYHKNNNPDFCNAFENNSLGMTDKLTEIEKLDTTLDIETFRSKLFSVEGRASAIYWSLIAKLLADDVAFEGRITQGATDKVNCMLNYGYTILYGRIWMALVKAKLNPYISFVHAQQEYKPTLVYDMVEEFRQQAVDRVVVSLITKGEKMNLEKGLLSYESRKRLSEKVSERIYTVENFRGKEARLSEIMTFQAHAAGDFLKGKTKNYKPYIAKW